MTECAECGGLGLVKGNSGLKACVCQGEARRAYAVRRAGIPEGFSHARLDNLKQSPTNANGLLIAKRFTQDFIPGKRETRGLMLTGSVGTGKTHLAVGVLRDLVERLGIEARFVDVRELLERIKASYDDQSRETQAGILKPILCADLVLIDELGAARPSDWVFETIELLIGGLYNHQVPVIVTTNLPNSPAAAASSNDYGRAMRQETLADRIGARMWSRLQQMCVAVDMTGPDWRGKR